MWAKVGAVLASLLIVPPGAARVPAGEESFSTPSGNIQCLYYKTEGESPSLRCEIEEVSNTPPARPEDCELDWGNAFEIAAESRRGERICHGDTIAVPNPRVIAYGETWSRGGFTCLSSREDLRCRNERGAGFALSRARQDVF
ncbi:hypothetical protein KK137_13710 [Croceibacterium sp. LX-88]|uniref:Ig-like domain-containing protein n=1 Tax=Croceibacterium selenioxidans TaxID=2838833 RepID=A0ABS5W6U3_9SPHN|nr:DUF6636 domain-containing protein [Croceibacterium selenioxidans]MBT2135389.1 hypothetical protein [Croceibacterium selenioxidans]